MTNLLVDKGCRSYFNYSDEICQNLSNHSLEKETVEILANNYSLYGDLMNWIAAIQMIFLSAWSDKYGRKIPLLLCTLGLLLADAGIILCVFFFESPLYYTVLTQLSAAVAGDIICLITIVNSHAAEASSEENRTLKYTTVEIAMGIGLCVGGFSGGMVFESYGYFDVYYIAVAAKVLAVVWLLIFVQETAGLKTNVTWKKKIRDFYVIESFTTSWKAVTRPRENNGRTYLLLYLVAIAILVNGYNVSDYTNYLFVHHLYNWDQGKYTIIFTLFTMVGMVAFACCVPVMVHVFRVSNPALGLIGVISMMSKFAIVAFSQVNIMSIYCVGNLFGCLGGLVSLAIRSKISQISDNNEKGLVFSFFATSEVMTPIVAKILYSQIFNATMDIYPSIMYLVMVACLCIPLGIFIWSYKQSQKCNLVSQTETPVSAD